MELCDSQPIRPAWVHPTFEQQLGQVPYFGWLFGVLWLATNRNAGWQIGLVSKHQAHKRLVALPCGVFERLRVVGHRRIGRENRRRGLHVTVVGEKLDGSRRAEGAEQLDHLRVGPS